MNDRLYAIMLEAGYAAPELALRAHKLAELIVKACADAADMAYDAQCAHPGDYVGEQLGYGEEHGITKWRME